MAVVWSKGGIEIKEWRGAEQGPASEEKDEKDEKEGVGEGGGVSQYRSIFLCANGWCSVMRMPPSTQVREGIGRSKWNTK